ncbi:MAG: adenylate/guanylate cyclase domain-containing protein [Nitrosomonadales bacterium]|nr:adenylate/guanylate cyclase domain-containing protein [Nitrosomonadales bacterium]
METHGNKTIMCSVLFLDIVEYSKKSVAGQISLKERFNEYLSAAISNVPIADRIILDTGDGAAINFLGDVEDALKAALSLRDSLSNEDPHVDPPLMVRIGINLGPVRLVRDINGQPNIVGDGINVAQRIMGFADVEQILVSRSYYDAVSRLSPQYAGMFHYQGSRTDKHVREHEVYAIGYPGDNATEAMATDVLAGEAGASPMRLMTRIKGVWNGAAIKLDDWIRGVVSGFKRAEPRQRALYVGAATVPIMLFFTVLIVKSTPQEAPLVSQDAEPPRSMSVEPKVVSDASKGEPETVTGQSKREAVAKPDGNKTKEPPKQNAVQQKAKPPQPADSKSWLETLKPSGGDAYISVSCKEGALVFVDGMQSGKIDSTGTLTIAVTSGKHAVIVSHASGGLYRQDVLLDSGKTVRVRPNFCK